MKFFNGDYQEASAAWQRSSDLSRNPWAIRNIALIHWRNGQVERAAELLAEAHSLTPSLLQLTIELGKCLIEAGKTGLWLNIVQQLPQAHQEQGRIRLLEAQAAVAEQDIQIVKRFFDDRITPPDLREGENSLTELWYAYHELRTSRDQTQVLDQAKLDQIKLEYPVPDFADFQFGVK